MAMFLWSRYALGWVGPLLFAAANELSGHAHLALIPVAILYSTSCVMCWQIRSVALSRTPSCQSDEQPAEDTPLDELELTAF
ncbi:MAG: hypothetical protein MHM6MM_001876 [Cercozoa sp. M6MM]